MNYQANSTFLEPGDGLVSASERLLNLELRHVLITVLAVGAVVSILIPTVFKKAYEKSVASAVPGYRWLLYGISFAVIAEFC